MSQTSRYEEFTVELAKYVPGVHDMRAGASEAAISQVEQTLARPLPVSYREFLHLFDGGSIFRECIHFYPTSRVFPKEADLVDANTRYRWPGIPDQDLVVAAYTWGDPVCLNGGPTSQAENMVYRWNHETGQRSKTWNSLAEYLMAEMLFWNKSITYAGRSVSSMRLLVNSIFDLFKRK